MLGTCELRHAHGRAVGAVLLAACSSLDGHAARGQRPAPENDVKAFTSLAASVRCVPIALGPRLPAQAQAGEVVMAKRSSETEDAIRRLDQIVRDLVRQSGMNKMPTPDSRMRAYLLDRHLRVVRDAEDRQPPE